ncbi:MAG: glycosyltransferase, partial [Anaerolineales bacterium]
MKSNFNATKSIDWFITQMKIKGGAERFVVNVLPLLAKHGWKIRLITLISDQDYTHTLRQQGLEVISLDAHGKWDLRVISKLIHLWKKSPPLILHTHLYHAAILGRLIGRICGIPIILCHQAGPELNRPPLRTFLDRITSAYVTRYLVSCQAVADILQRREGIAPEKILIIPNGIPIPTQPKSTILHPNSSLRLITIGRLSPEKNHSALLKAIAELSQSAISLHLDILGEGEEKHNLIQL